ncbi:MAG: hypothetical protein ACRDZM_12145 [Acidimicrobiia bacterium]
MRLATIHAQAFRQAAMYIWPSTNDDTRDVPVLGCVVEREFVVADTFGS